jgi:formylglycine-generating enzyme
MPTRDAEAARDTRASRPTPPRSPEGPPPSDRSAVAGPDLVVIQRGAFVMGDGGELAYPADGEIPRTVDVESFALAATAVTNAEFAAFVAATGHRSDAERFGWSFVFGGLLPDDFEPTRGVAAAPWWRQVYGADWARPEGPHSDVAQRGDHPVVHVSWNDAQAYARWSGTRLPTEAEWEYAARAGTTSTYWWGDELEPAGHHRMNVFQGEFPAQNTADDGWLATCPVDAFDPSPWGLYNQLGNVWEWTAGTFRTDPLPEARRTATGDSDTTMTMNMTMKGGSYLCHASYCRRYRPSARMGSSRDSSAGNVGFRVAR